MRLHQTSLGGALIDSSGRLVVVHPATHPTGIWLKALNGKVRESDLLLPNDGRGFCLLFEDGLYTAGCREFDYDTAVEHWSNPDHAAPESAALLLAAVRDHHARTAPPKRRAPRKKAT